MRPYEERNQATLEALLEAGANSSKLHCVEHHFYAASEEIMEHVMALGRERGYGVANAGKDEEEWSLDLTIRSLPVIDELERQSKEMEEIAEAASATYDGWGTEVET